MSIVLGAPININTSLSSLDSLENFGLSTFEIIGDAFHGIGDDGDFMQFVLIAPGLEDGNMYHLYVQFEVVSGRVFTGRGLSNTQIVGFGAGPYRLRLPFIHNESDTVRLRFACAQDASEFTIDFLVLQPVLSGGNAMPAAVGYGYIDFDGDTRSFTLPIVDADAVTHDARETEIEALRDAIDGVVQVNRTRMDFIIEREDTGAAKPSIQAAQVNIEWKVTYVDDVTGDVETVRLPGADLTIAGILLPSSNVADLTNTEMAALVTAFEAVVLSSAGNAVTIQSIAFLE